MSYICQNILPLSKYLIKFLQLLIGNAILAHKTNLMLYKASVTKKEKKRKERSATSHGVKSSLYYSKSKVYTGSATL